MRRTLICLAVGASVAFVVASCGSAAPSAADYRQRLDGLCASLSQFDRDLPQLQASQHLSESQLQARVRQQGEKFQAAVAGLTPSPELSSGHQALVGDLEHQPAESASQATVIGHARLLLSDYTALGATGCATAERQAVATLSALPSVNAQG